MAGNEIASNLFKPAAGLESVGTFHLASNFDAEPIKKENPLSNANLPGGLFTHPGLC
jgi:hypothetical protein